MASESAVIAWGSGEDGQLGIGNNEEREWVCTITSLRSRKISSVVAGSRNSLAICQDGKLFTWGWNQRGTLGHPPETKTESVPSQVKALANVKIVQAAIGGWHCLAVDDQGRAYAWGGNEYGQCGEEPERKEDTGTPIRRDIVIPQRCVPKLSVRQCRQKTRDFAAACTNQAKNNKLCTILYCHKCLLNRYGEKAEEVTISGEWNCPKCRGICNCSICIGQQPTGILINTAKRTGFSSVSEMLLKGGDKFNTESEEAVSHTGTSPKKEAMVSPTKRGKENSFDGKLENTLPNPDGKKVEEGHLKRKETSPYPIEKKLKKTKVTGDFIQEAELNVGVDLEEDNERREEEDGEGLLKQQNDDFHAEEVLLPVGRELTSVAGIDVPAEDVGSALQFVEFCTVFRNILDIKKGQPESVLRDILHGRTGRHGKFSATVQLQIQLLSIIQNDQGEECEELGPSSWFNALKECLAESKSVLEAQGLGHIENTDDYETLSASEKLKLLNILCDEVLGTEKLRTWMVDQKTKQKEKVKETRENFLASKNEVKELKKKKQEVVAKAIINGQGGLTISEHEAIVSSIEVETEKARAKMLESEELLANIGQNTNILRTEPIFTSSNGHAYWRLNATGNSEVFCLNIRKGDTLSSENKWSVLDTDEKESIEKHLSSLSLRGKKGKKAKDPKAPRVNRSRGNEPDAGGLT